MHGQHATIPFKLDAIFCLYGDDVLCAYSNWIGVAVCMDYPFSGDISVQNDVLSPKEQRSMGFRLNP